MDNNNYKWYLFSFSLFSFNNFSFFCRRPQPQRRPVEHGELDNQLPVFRCIYKLELVSILLDYYNNDDDDDDDDNDDYDNDYYYDQY